MSQSVKFSDALADEICERLADGESLADICKSENMPNRATVFRWLDKHPEFAAMYAWARDVQRKVYEDECIQIADDARNDWMMKNAPDNAGWAFNGDHVQRSRLRIDTRKWAAAKFGRAAERIDVTHTGPNGGTIRIVREIVEAKNGQVAESYPDDDA